MKQIMLLLLLMTTLKSYSQNYPSIAGVKFGTDYKTCKEKFDNRFNRGQNSEQESVNFLLKYNTVSFADTFFDWVEFGFQTDIYGKSYLASADFIISYNLTEKENVKKKRDELFDFYKQKYDFRWSGVDDNGWKYYVLGHDPINPDAGLIAIGVIQTPQYLFLSVGYGPINFIDQKEEI